MPDPLLVDVARILANVAADVVMPRWRNLGDGDISEKTGPADIVTIADREAELALAAKLQGLLPGSVVVGEEAVAADAAVIQKLKGTGPTWVIDPIDGTSAFAAGEPEFALMVALVEEGKPRVGWIYAPAIAQLTCGGPAHGTWQGRRGDVLQKLPQPRVPGTIGEMVGLLGKRNISDARRAELQAKEGHFRGLDAVTCAGIDYARIARGQAHFALYSKSEPWDHLPGLAILSAHGFHAAKHDGSPYRPGDNTGGLLVAPDVKVFDAIRSVLLDAPPRS